MKPFPSGNREREIPPLLNRGDIPAIPKHEVAGLIRLILTLDQTAELVRQAGGESHLGRVFAVVSPGSYPTAPGRLVMHLIECESISRANDAAAVARGLANIRRMRTPTKALEASQAHPSASVTPASV